MSDDNNRVDIHIVLEGNGVESVTALVDKVLGGNPRTIDPVRIEPPEHVDIEGKYCPECGFVTLVDPDGIVVPESSHLNTCPHYKGN